MRHATPTTVAALLVIALTGCAGMQPSPTGSVVPTITAVSPAPTVHPTDSASTDRALTIPGCDELIPLDQVQQYEAWANVVLLQDEAELGAELPGPAAQHTAAEARQSQGCSLGVPQSDAMVAVAVLEIDGTARDRLIRELRSEPEYTETDVEGAPSFASSPEEGMGGTTVSYTFVGTAWIILRGTLVDPVTATRIISPVLGELAAANPGLSAR